MQLTPIVSIELECQPRDIWVGLYWKKTGDWTRGGFVDVYVCVIPMLPIHIVFLI